MQVPAPAPAEHPAATQGTALWAVLALAVGLTLGATEAAQAARRTPKEEAPPAAERPNVLQATVLHVLDGDTLIVRPRASDGTTTPPHPLRVRLMGIDAPELCQRGGGEARSALSELVAGQWVHATLFSVDRYSRLIARVTVGDVDVAARLVGQGLAWSDARASRTDPYVQLEKTARANHRGVFADGAEPTHPKEFRQQHGACPHAPGSRLRQLGMVGPG